MRQHLIATFVIAVPILASAQPSTAARQQLGAITEAAAYAVYAAVVPPAWARVSKEELLLQEETERIERITTCFSIASTTDPDWSQTLANFISENARPRVLRRILPVEISYRLIPQAQLRADDARLALEHPDALQRQYAAVSAVGFNAAKTKALVYVRLRSRGDLYSSELRDGKWSANGNACGWIE